MLLISNHLPGQGIRFSEPSAWPEVLDRAARESKPLFIYCGTDWSGPCQKMRNQVFPDSAVGAFFNDHFVNVRLDMEQGEGPALAARYRVQLYPSYLFLDADGQVVHRAAGFLRPGALLRLGETAANPLLQLAALEKRYAAGDRSARLLFALTAAKAATGDPATGQLANDYLQGQTDLSRPENLDFILRYVDDPYSPGFLYLVAHRATLEQHFSRPVLAEKVNGVFENYRQNHPQLPLGELQRLYAAVYPENGERLASRCRLDYYRQAGASRAFAEAAIDHYRRFPTDDPDELNEIAGLFFQEIQDPKLLEWALGQAKRSVVLQENATHCLTLAQLNWKLGRKKAAIHSARRALALARGEETATVRALLDKIKAS